MGRLQAHLRLIISIAVGRHVIVAAIQAIVLEEELFLLRPIIEFVDVIELILLVIVLCANLRRFNLGLRIIEF